MNFDFSDEQKMLQEQVRKYLADACPTSRVREVFEGGETHAPEIWSGLAKLGCMGAAIPEKHGGLGLGTLELCVIAEELGRALAPAPFSSSICLAAEAIKLGGSEETQNAWLPKLASGETIGALALAEGPHAAVPKLIKTRLEGGKLHGQKWPVADGMCAHIAIAAARDKSKLILGIVDLTGPGVSREAVETIDPSRGHADIRFAGAPFTPLEGEKGGEELLGHLLDRAAVLTAFEQIGGAEAALDMACDYARQRYAFGRQIGSFQAIKHKLADAYIKNQLARANAYYAAMTLAEDGADLPAAAASARVSATEAFTYAAQENVQTHGGIGFTWESDCQFFYRRARLLALSLGAPLRWRERLVRALEIRNAP